MFAVVHVAGTCWNNQKEACFTKRISHQTQTRLCEIYDCLKSTFTIFESGISLRPGFDEGSVLRRHNLNLPKEKKDVLSTCHNSGGGGGGGTGLTALQHCSIVIKYCFFHTAVV